MRTADGSDPGTHATLILVHGSGHTAQVWGDVQSRLRHRSVAADVEAATEGPLLLVGHSAGGIVLPALAARLGPRVVGLVFVAGLSAKHGERVIDTVRPEVADLLDERLAAMRVEHAGAMLDPDPSVDAVRVLDARTAASLDSLNYMTQIVSWDGVPDELPRTFVRCLRDRIQPRALQAALVGNCGATEVVDLQSGHTPAVAVPDELASVLDRIAARSREPATRAIIDG